MLPVTPTRRQAVDLLGAALQLWEGPAFGDRADVDGVRAEALRLEERRAAAREAQATALLAVGRIDEAVAAASALTTAEPLREGGWAVLIEALTGAHRTAEALRAFRRAVAALRDAGLEPSARLREAERFALSGEVFRARDATAQPNPPVRTGGSNRQSFRRLWSGGTTMRDSLPSCSTTPAW